MGDEGAHRRRGRVREGRTAPWASLRRGWQVAGRGLGSQYDHGHTAHAEEWGSRLERPGETTASRLHPLVATRRRARPLQRFLSSRICRSRRSRVSSRRPRDISIGPISTSTRVRPDSRRGVARRRFAMPAKSSGSWTDFRNAADALPNPDISPNRGFANLRRFAGRLRSAIDHRDDGDRRLRDRV